MGIAFTQMSATRIIGALTSKSDDARTHVISTFTFFTKTIVLELQHGSKRKGIIRTSHINILGAHPCIWPQQIFRIMTSDG